MISNRFFNEVNFTFLNTSLMFSSLQKVFFKLFSFAYIYSSYYSGIESDDNKINFAK